MSCTALLKVIWLHEFHLVQVFSYKSFSHTSQKSTQNLYPKELAWAVKWIFIYINGSLNDGYHPVCGILIYTLPTSINWTLQLVYDGFGTYHFLKWIIISSNNMIGHDSWKEAERCSGRFEYCRSCIATVYINLVQSWSIQFVWMTVAELISTYQDTKFPHEIVSVIVLLFGAFFSSGCFCKSMNSAPLFANSLRRLITDSWLKLLTARSACVNS